MTTETSLDHLDVVIHLSNRAGTLTYTWAAVSAPWGELGDITVRTGISIEGKAAAIMSALECVITLRGAAHIDLYVAERDTLNAAQYLSERLSAVSVYKYTTRCPHPLHAEARHAARHMLTETPETFDRPTTVATVDRTPPARVTVATDGSWSRFNHAAGVGVLFADGRWRSAAYQNFPSALAAELKAVELALDLSETGNQPLTILCDSRPAISMLTGVSTPDKRKIPFLGRLLARLAQRDVEFVWVKGHAGHPLNDGADRLAVAARRNDESGVSRAVATDICANIVAEALAGYCDDDSYAIPA